MRDDEETEPEYEMQMVIDSPETVFEIVPADRSHTSVGIHSHPIPHGLPHISSLRRSVSSPVSVALPHCGFLRLTSIFRLRSGRVVNPVTVIQRNEQDSSLPCREHTRADGGLWIQASSITPILACTQLIGSAKSTSERKVFNTRKSFLTRCGTL